MIQLNPAGRRRRRGVTLIELLVTLVLISVAALALVESARYVQMMNTRAQLTLAAVCQAQSQLDSLRGQAMQGAAPTTGVLMISSGLLNRGSVSWTVTPDGLRLDLYSVTATVTWPDTGRRQNTGGSISLTTTIYVKQY